MIIVVNNALQDLRNTHNILYCVTLGFKSDELFEDFRFPQQCCWRCSYFGMWYCVSGW